MDVLDNHPVIVVLTVCIGHFPVCLLFVYLLQLKRLMGGRNWKHKKESVTLLDLNEEQIAQSGQHMRLTHSTEEMDALALASKVG